MDVNEKKKRPCVVPVCHGERFNLVHKFPMELERTMKWLEALQIPELYKVSVDKLRTSYFICSRHFRSKDYKNAISRHLNKTAVPSLNITNLDINAVERCFPVLENSGLNLMTVDQNSIQETSQNIETNAPEKRKTVDSNYVFKKSRTFEADNKISLEPKMSFAQHDELSGYALVIGEINTIDKEEINVNLDVVHVHEPNDPIPNENSDADEIEEDLILMREELNNGHMENVEGMATNFIEVSHPDFPEVLTLDNFWLRDHCRCKICYNFDTNQRKYNLLDIPLDVKPLVTDVRDGMLYVKWDDGHESCFNFEFLYQSQISFVKKSSENIVLLWNSKLISTLNYTRVCLSKLVTSKDAVKAVLKSIVTFGFAFIENVPPNQDMTEMAVRRLFPIQKTFFGDMWTFSDKRDHSDTAYSKEYLGPHTDNTYFNDAAGLQVFHCIKHNGNGGETILVDGFKVIRDLKDKNPEAYEALRKVSVPAEYIEEDQHHIYSAPLIKVNDLTDDPEQIRLNVYDRSIFNTLPQSEIFEFYKNFRDLLKLVEENENKWIFKLKPGTVLIFDNWRILHGREKYTGIREIAGCYVSRTDFLSKARIFDLIS